MTDVSYHHPNRGYAVRPWPLQHFAEVATFLILLFMTVRVAAFGKVTTLLWLGMLGLLILSHRQMVAKVLLKWWPLLLTPLLAALSFFWSDAPSISGRYGLQLLMTAFTGILLARVLPPSKFLTVLFLMMFVFCAGSLAYQRYDEGVLIGLVGSKNQMSFMSYVLLFAAYATIFNPGAPKLVRLLALPGVLLGTFLVATTSSATAYLMSAFSVGLFTALMMLHRVKPASRVGLILALLVIASPILFVLPEIDRAINDFLINVLHKDPGLTGRDYLWARANELIAQRPLLGYGFQAFWMGNSTEAQVLLGRFGQSDGRVFNFHNTYLQFAVDVGVIGAVALALTVAAAVIAFARRYVVEPTVPMTFFFVFFVLSVGRTMTEVMLAPFASQCLMFFFCMAYAFWRPTSDWSEDQAEPPPPPEPIYPYPIPQGSPYPVSLHRMRAPAGPAAANLSARQ